MLVTSIQHTSCCPFTLTSLRSQYFSRLLSSCCSLTNSFLSTTALLVLLATFKWHIPSVFLSLTPGCDRTCLLPAGVWLVCWSGAWHITDYQVIHPIRKALHVNFPRQVRGVYCDPSNWYLPHRIVNQQHTVKVTCELAFQDKFFFLGTSSSRLSLLNSRTSLLFPTS